MSEETTPKARDLIFPRLDSFLTSMRAIGDVEDFVKENAGSLDSVENSFAVQAKRFYPGLGMEIHRRAADYIHPMVHKHMDGVAALEERGATQAELDEWKHSWDDNMKQRLAELTGEPEYFYKYARVWNRLGNSSVKTRLLRNSLLMAAVSDFEVLVSGLVRAFLTFKPEILRSADTKYSFADIEPFSTVDEFRHHAVENMADMLLRGGFEDWMDWFDKKRKIRVEGVTDNADALMEIFQRRHLLVHNGGVVNRFYLAKVSGDSVPAAGQVLGVSSKYLKRSLEELTVAGVKLALSLVMKLEPASDDMKVLNHQLHHIGFDFLTAESWHIAFRLNDWHLGFVDDSSTRLVATVNKWVAQKHVAGSESIRLEVEKWDTTTLTDIYKLAKFALLDQDDEAYALVQSLIARDELDLDDWRDWPVLEGVRSYEAANVEERNRLWLASFGDSHHH
ncbi:hypothetical protein V1638_09180 [Pseudarthrobacter sp. J64]|uniref:hypothetical protein n=1 Tax=Pseudarthrobacter sp. J64 TaxID=3116485 RepID=UPI002E811466|nr:hypothetical protein [Pseudarthrobacter sp. J64]MEE2569567.1 hypothetical protein [Pseudarthrobacter sp. J64]